MVGCVVWLGLAVACGCAHLPLRRDTRLFEQLQHSLHARGGLVLRIGFALAEELLERLLQTLILAEVDRRRDAQTIEQLLS